MAGNSVAVATTRKIVVMQELRDFVMKHAVRGTCTCGRCLDTPEEGSQPIGHTVDMVFFKVAAEGAPDPEELRRLVTENQVGEFCTLDLFDDAEKSYIQVGGWIGEQSLGMMLMGLGHILGLWRVLTPRMLGLPENLVQQMAGAGMVSIVPTKKVAV